MVVGATVVGGTVVVGSGASIVKLKLPSITWPSLAVTAQRTPAGPPAIGVVKRSRTRSGRGLFDRIRTADLTLRVQHLVAVLHGVHGRGEVEDDLADRCHHDLVGGRGGRVRARCAQQRGDR